MPTTSGTLRAAQARSDQIEHFIQNPAGAETELSRLRVLTGDRPTGALHIGHYLSTLRNRVRLQNAGISTFLVIADYQVITDRDSVGQIRQNVLGCLADYLAAGIDPEKTVIFAHSAIPAIGQLMLPFLSLVTDAELRRNPTVKEELAATGSRAMSGLLLSYPVHQACDILFCGGNVVPVGQDQLPHIELTRTIARRFNSRYAGGEQVFTEPDALLTSAPMLLGVDGRKMAKSRGNSVTLEATSDQTTALIRQAKTDSEKHITFEPQRRPEVANLLTIAGQFLGEDPSAVAQGIGDGGSSALKKVVATAINDGLVDHRSRRTELLRHPDYLMEVLRHGNRAATAIAETTLHRVNAVLGMRY